MPAKLRVQLVGPPPAHAFQYANELRALVYVWIGRCRPERASAFHGANAPKPYAISPVQSEGDRCWFQVSLLDDRLVGPVTEVAAREGKLRLGQEPYTLVGVQVREEVTWEELLPTEVRARPRFRVRLLTPTAQHVPGPHRKVAVVPSAENYFASWLNRWKLCAGQWECAPFAVDESVLGAVESNVVIAGFKGGTEVVRNLDARRQFLGFVGEVEFEVLRPQSLSHGVRASLEALGWLANYCGTGVETMRGMGQTEVRIEEKAGGR